MAAVTVHTDFGDQINTETIIDTCMYSIHISPKSLQMVTAAMKLKDACSLEESYDQPRQAY